MKLLSHIKTARINLLSSKLRALLTMLGIIVGTGSVVALLSSGQLATEAALAQFASLGIDLMAVSFRAKDPNDTRLAPITLARLDDLKKQIKTVERIAPYIIGSATGSFHRLSLDNALVGTTEDLLPVLRLKIQQGRFINNVDKSAHFCVLGSDTFKQLRTLNPIGQKIRLNNFVFTIIGIAEPTGDNSFFHANINNSIIIPLQSFLLLSSTRKLNDGIFQLKANVDPNEVKTQISGYFAQKVPGYDLDYQSAQEMIKGMAAQQEVFTLLLGFIGSISLFVGGIGVMNIMLASISERKYEVGLRIALGARPSDIQWMFLFEAIGLATVGGSLGVFLGFCSTYLISKIAGWEFSFLFFPPLIGFSASMLICILFGFYPARLAAKLNPIAALRGS